MCYLAREQQAHEPSGAALPAPGPDRVRPRWAGALAFSLVGGLALAGLVAPSPTAKLPDVPMKQSATVAGTHATAMPGTGGTGKTALPMDDGVPAPTQDSGMKTGFGPCNHGL
jgi:hypothetical protein